MYQVDFVMCSISMIFLCCTKYLGILYPNKFVKRNFDPRDANEKILQKYLKDNDKQLA